MALLSNKYNVIRAQYDNNYSLNIVVRPIIVCCVLICGEKRIRVQCRTHANRT